MTEKNEPQASDSVKPLDGIRVLELGQLLAGPFTGTQLAYFGAEVIKVEPPNGGDPIRGWREVKDGTSLWWHSIARNKKCVTLDLKSAKGRDIVRQLVAECDVLIENFRPGKMESWQLGPEDIKKINPDIIYTRISGYGQTGPYAAKPGFASVTEGFSGFRYLNGFEGEAPVRANISMGDTMAGMQAFMGILLALLHRGKKPENQGQVVDIALYESMFNLLEAVVPEYDGAGVVRQPAGTTVTGIVPTNTYQCRDGKYVIIGGNGDSIFKRLMKAAGQPEMADDPRMSDNRGRVVHEKEIDRALSEWTQTLDGDQVLALLETANVPAGPIYNIEDMINDPHYQARGMFEEVQVRDQVLKIPAIMPKLDSTPGGTEWPGPELGAHNTEVFQQFLGLSDDQIKHLEEENII
ncbi:MAG: carnitine dehydratase [Gammaproteobacteria bacterium]|nr:MAG: carnitine dehydratase [Gammaproteobacteria bacterium]